MEKSYSVIIYPSFSLDIKEWILHVRPEGWEDIFSKCEEELEHIGTQLLKESSGTDSFLPARKNIFRIFFSVHPNEIKVLLLGQDPYHSISKYYGEGEWKERPTATGFAFDVGQGVKIPPSLLNMYKECKNCFGEEYEIPENGDLSHWVDQGVFLLNTALTVKQGKAGSHSDIWLCFTKKVLEILLKNNKIVLLLLGNDAKNIIKGIDTKCKIVSCAHPSPFSANRGFFNSYCFANVNNCLIDNGLEPIKW